VGHKLVAGFCWVKVRSVVNRVWGCIAEFMHLVLEKGALIMCVLYAELVLKLNTFCVKHMGVIKKGVRFLTPGIVYLTVRGGDWVKLIYEKNEKMF